MLSNLPSITQLTAEEAEKVAKVSVGAQVHGVH